MYHKRTLCLSLISSINLIKNLKFTIDRFDDNNIQFLDNTIDKNKIDLCWKPTDTGQYSAINSKVSWNYKISWTKSFYHRAEKFVLQPKSLGLKLLR